VEDVYFCTDLLSQSIFMLFRKELERVAPEMNIVREIPFYWNWSFFCIEQVRLIAKMLADLALRAAEAGVDLDNVGNVRVEFLEVEGDWVARWWVDLVDAFSLTWKVINED